MKYTFEIMKEYEDAFKGISVYSVSEEKKLMVDFVAREELEDAQKKIDEAYHRGWEYGKEYGSDEADMREAVSYQKGLDDAWEAARKISLMSPDEIEKVFPGAAKYNRYNLGYSGVEAIAKLKAYEEKKADDEIKAMDEVVWTEDEDVVIVVTRVYTVNDIEWCDGVCRDGKVYHILTDNARKTGRRFEIEKLLEEMKRED